MTWEVLVDHSWTACRLEGQERLCSPIDVTGHQDSWPDWYRNMAEAVLKARLGSLTIQRIHLYRRLRTVEYGKQDPEPTNGTVVYTDLYLSAAGRDNLHVLCEEINHGVWYSQKVLQYPTKCLPTFCELEVQQACLTVLGPLPNTLRNIDVLRKQCVQHTVQPQSKCRCLEKLGPLSLAT